MNCNKELKARLYDVMEELEHALHQRNKAQDELDDVRGELLTMRNIAEQRGEMIRELITENRKLRNQLIQPPKVNVDVVKQETIQEVLHVIEEHFPSKEKEFIF